MISSIAKQILSHIYKHCTIYNNNGSIFFTTTTPLVLKILRLLLVLDHLCIIICGSVGKRNVILVSTLDIWGCTHSVKGWFQIDVARGCVASSYLCTHSSTNDTLHVIVVTIHSSVQGSFWISLLVSLLFCQVWLDGVTRVCPWWVWPTANVF
jgi:hypothetical protein